MPKGVEHSIVETALGSPYKVQLSVMPKGVEHMNEFGTQVSEDAGATISDAERR